MLYTHLTNQLSKDLVGQKVVLAGWVWVRRDHGKIIFIDLRDSYGVVQVVFLPKCPFYNQAKELRSEYVIKVEGKVNLRPKGMENPSIETGEIEVVAENLEILNIAKTLPFEIDDRVVLGEEIRLRYRYLDIRRPQIKNLIVLRHKAIQFCRDFLTKRGFIEIETPYLTKGTPEGAREYVIPSRVSPGRFYVLPQAPQQFKQLLMMAGIPKYFQIARCFRDEDPRADRQPEFTQLDMEMSFINEEDILKLVEELIISLVKNIFPKKKIAKIPFPRITYQEAMKKYKSDKPDLREDKNDPNELAFCFIVDFPLFEYSESERKLVSVHNPFTSPKPEDIFLLDKEPLKAKSRQYDFVCNGVELAGGAIRIHQPDLQRKIFKILGLDDQEIENRFGHLIQALSFGAPPHGGIAPGIDRLLMILTNQESIRAVIPFPKTSDAKDLMMGAPAEITKEQLKELHIKIVRSIRINS